MHEKPRLGAMGRRLLGGFLVVALIVLAVHTIGTVIPHVMAAPGHLDPVSPAWLLAATAASAALAVVISLVVTRRMVAPMQEVLVMARAFAAGAHDVRVPDFGRPELAELADALNSAASEVERSEQARRRLTADIAHELRTPLAALQAGLEELRDGFVSPDRARLAALHDQAARLGRIVNDLGELAAAESVELGLTFEPVDLADVAERAMLARTVSLTGAGLAVRLDTAPGVVVLADEDRLHQIVGNLLSNTALYCRSGDRVVVRVRREGAHGLLEVEDTGPGFQDDELNHAFDRSWRGTSSGGTQGSGLGLPIVRALLLAQNGRIDISSETGKGTTVRVTLPLHAEPPVGASRADVDRRRTRDKAARSQEPGNVDHR